MKTTLTKEESQRLIDLGVDPKMATYSDVVADENGNHYVEKLIFSLADLLSILPKEIGERNLSMEYDSGFKQWYVGYNLWRIESASELIDALYQLLILIWCLEQKNIKLNED